MKDKWIVCDLDGTLCDEGHRSQYANAGQWDDYHARCFDDKPFDDVISVLRLMTRDIGLLVITGRTEQYRELSRRWFTKHKILPDELLMRPDGSFEKANILKLQQLETFFGTKAEALEKVLLVLEDSDKVVQAWRDYGIPCWQVRSRA